jgi:hypothetical protein
MLIGAALLALIVVVVVLGTMLPRGHVASRSRKFSRPTPEIYAAVERLTTESKDVPFEVVERQEPTKLVTRVKPGESFGGTWTYEIASDGTLTITERGEVYNPVFRFLSRYVFGHTATIDAFLERLSARLA